MTSPGLAILFDISTAYELIQHDKLWAAAMRLGFSPTLLRWLLHTFQMPRKLQLIEGLSDEVLAVRSVVPGNSFADIAMRMAVTEVVQSMAAALNGKVCGRHPGHIVWQGGGGADGGPASGGIPHRGFGGTRSARFAAQTLMVGNNRRVLCWVASKAKPVRGSVRRSVRNLGAD